MTAIFGSTPNDWIVGIRSQILDTTIGSNSYAFTAAAFLLKNLSLASCPYR
jgi:hypothetical protein